MTTSSNSYDDLLDSQQSPAFTDFLATVRLAYAGSAADRLPDGTRRSIRALIAQEAQATTASTRGQTELVWPKLPSRWLPVGAWGRRTGVVRYLSLACIALALVATLLAYNATTTTTPSVSASSVLRLAAGYSLPAGRFAHFTYRVRVTYIPSWTGILRCLGRTRHTVTSYSQVWIRGREGNTPQAVVERSKPCDSGTWPGCPSVVVGRQLYEYPGACLEGPSRPASVDILSNDWPTTTLPSNLYYGPSAAHFLQHSLPDNATVEARHTVFQGRPVYELEVKNWPGDNPTDDVALYFESKTGLLIGMNEKNKYVTWRVRLINQQWRGAETAWASSVAQLPHWKSRADGAVAFPYLFSMSDFIRACPAVARASIPVPTPTPISALLKGQEPTEKNGRGLLAVCRKVQPHMTRRLLAWRLMRTNRDHLYTAARLGVIPAREARYSIAAEHRQLAIRLAQGDLVLSY
jgi:hypothetical protein